MTPFAVRSIGPDAIAVVGEIDASTADEFAAACGNLGPHVTIDCGDCDFIDSAGLSVLLSLRSRVGREGGEVRLVDPSHAVRRLIEVSGLDGVFEVVDTAS
jgi:anti-sigma B factor antagonist